MRAFSDAPNRIKRGFAKIMHKAVKTTANVQTIVKLVFIIVLAALSSLMPLFIEKSGAPPLPKRLEKAIVSIIIRKAKPHSTECSGSHIRYAGNVYAVYYIVQQA